MPDPAEKPHFNHAPPDDVERHLIHLWGLGVAAFKQELEDHLPVVHIVIICNRHKRHTCTDVCVCVCVCVCVQFTVIWLPNKLQNSGPISSTHREREFTDASPSHLSDCLAYLPPYGGVGLPLNGKEQVLLARLQQGWVELQQLFRRPTESPKENSGNGSHLHSTQCVG